MKLLSDFIIWITRSRPSTSEIVWAKRLGYEYNPRTLEFIRFAIPYKDKYRVYSTREVRNHLIKMIESEIAEIAYKV